MKGITKLLANYLFVAYGRHRNTNELFEQQHNVQLLWLERADSLIEYLGNNGITISLRKIHTIKLPPKRDGKKEKK
jgi:hypothetical protein